MIGLSRDGAHDRRERDDAGLRGIVEAAPARTVRPESADEAAAAVRDAAARNLDMVPRGLGHSTYGQSLTAASPSTCAASRASG
ncbi:FAD-binding protein [Actinomadura madurae]|uniref:FAD-binding protein n=1 Tax=Actinomadura madurae TaxID=1993 RepID=UPI0020D236DD|nr:FAD-binding protein [Actinomadura madurae]MCQ0004048.1 FAD-binding protein [Actinomadura madurae]